MKQNFTLSINEENGQTTITPGGMLDTSSSPEFQDRIAAVLGKENPDIIMEMSELEYISSQGIRCILSLIKTVMANNGKLVFRRIKPAVKEIFDISGLSQAMTIE